MDFSAIGHVIYGFLSGLTEILPVSARAHSTIYLKLLGYDDVRGFPNLLSHIGILAALYTYSRIQLTKMARARKLARIPKKRRKRPLDVDSLMNSSFVITMALPVVLMLLFYDRITSFDFGLPIMAAFLFVNGLILYIPQFLPGSNRDARTLSRFDGLLMGLGSTLSAIPGFSGIGAALSIGSIRGVDKNYGLNMTLIASMVYFVGLIVFDVLSIIVRGFGPITMQLIGIYLLAAAAAFISTMLAIRIMRTLAAENGYHFFAYYCWGAALFTFILNLMA